MVESRICGKTCRCISPRMAPWQLVFRLMLTASLASAQISNTDTTLLYDTSRGKDYLKDGGRITLTTPMNFYDQSFSTIYVHTNGYITFAGEKVWLPSYFRENKLIAPCMVEIKDNNNLGLIRFLVTSEEHQLNRATADIVTHFANEADFKAQHIVVIEWNGLILQETTIQNVIIIGKRKTFALFLFKNKNGQTFDADSQNFDAQSGFSIGDRVRYTELLDFTMNRNLDYLFKGSNTMMAGKWIFMIGSQDNELFQVQMPDSYSVYDKNSGKMIKKDFDECKQRVSACHRFADCFNAKQGYKCICSKTYFGNGRTCLREYSLINIEGKISGEVNDIKIGAAEMVAHISQNRGELFVTIGPVNKAFGHSFQMVPTLTGLLGWLFGKSINGKTGYDIVGNRFKSTSIIIFKTGEILYIKQEMKGFDEFNNLVFDTEVNGTMPIPLTKASSVQNIKPYQEKYALSSNKKIYGDGSTTYVVDENSIDYTVNRLVNYETVNSNMEYKALVRVMDTLSAYYDTNKLLRFRQKYTISEDETTIPTEDILKVSTTPKPRLRTTQRTDSKETEPETTSYAEVTTNIPDAKATTRERVSTKESDGLRKTTEIPVTIRQPLTTSTPNVVKVTEGKAETTVRTLPPPSPMETIPPPCANKCSENAECKNINGMQKCICKAGFTGNGTNCKVDKRISCGSYKCDENSECIQEQSQYLCKCKKGFIGDGVTCYVDVPCDCHINAECYSGNEGTKICVCKLGFVGDGKRCKDINECRDMRIMCQSNSKCINTIGSYHCLCNKGFRKNGTKCLDIPECTEQKDACGENAICTEIPGSYQCRCPKGFHFGYRKRDCFPDCPRCLNGGTCVGKFGCKCALGYSGEICQWVGDEFLLYAQGGNIKRFSYPYGPMSYGYIYRNPEKLMVGVDYDCNEKKVYWTDVISGSIQRSNYNGTGVEVVVNGLVDPQGITVDWLGRNIFWTDNGNNNIQVSKLNGKHRKVLHSHGLTRPRPIVCNPYTGQLFWADWDRTNPRIEYSSMDGSDRKILVSRDIGSPNGLTIDYKARDLCWTDAELRVLSCIGLDGRNQRQLTRLAGYPFGITMHDSFIYWTNWDTDNIGKFDKRNNKEMLEIRSGFGFDGRLFDIKSVSACPARKNVCGFENGGCLGLCLMKIDGTRTCG